MAVDSLALHEHFPAVSNADWRQLVPDSLNWHPPEGFEIRPFYRKSARTFSRVYSDPGWRLRLDGRPSEIPELIESGATAIGIGKAEDLKESELSAILRTVSGTGIPCFFECGTDAVTVTSRLVTAARALKLPPDQLQGALALDARQPTEEHQRLIIAAEGTCYRTVHIDLTPWHLAGADMVQELALAVSLLAHCLSRLEVGAAASRIYFTVPVGHRYLMAIAYVRALRHLARQVFEAHGAPTSAAYLEGVPSARYLTTLDDGSHLARITLQCMAAAIGGCELMTVHGARARRIPLILQHEAAVDHTADPAAGAWFIEILTDKLGRAAWGLFQKMEAMGGFSEAHEWITEQIAESARRRTRRVRTGRQSFVGVNCFSASTRQAPPPAMRSGLLAQPFEDLRRRVQSLPSPPDIRLLNGPPESVGWTQRVLRCAGLAAKAPTDRASLRIIFSPAEATGADTPTLLVLDRPPARPVDAPVLLSGGDLVAAAHFVIDLATGEGRPRRSMRSEAS